MNTIKRILAIMVIAALCVGGAVLAEEAPTGKIITPNNPEIDIEALADGIYPAAFEPAALADGALTLTVYSEDNFDIVEISQLAPGDTLYVGDTVVDVETVEEDDGDLLINGGLDNGGVTLRAYDEDNCWKAVEYDDHHTYFNWGETTLPLSDNVSFTDGWDIEKDPVTVTGAEAVRAARTSSCTPHAWHASARSAHPLPRICCTWQRCTAARRGTRGGGTLART